MGGLQLVLPTEPDDESPTVSVEFIENFLREEGLIDAPPIVDVAVAQGRAGVIVRDAANDDAA